MYSTKEMSVFDIIGPNMIGPSSSHTAGALRIARLARNMVKRPIEEVTFVLYGSFAMTYQGHGTDKALVAGMLGFDTEDERIKESFTFAKEAGLKYQFKLDTNKVDVHPNTVDIQITVEGGETTTITGVSIGGGRAVLKKINGVEIDLSGDYYTVVIRHRDLPGVVAAVTDILSKYNINIAFMKLYRENRGTIAYSIIETDESLIEEIIDRIEELGNVFQAFLIEKL
ncbi:L-serine dehydratase, iron-sulfur-dependent subunit beta [Anaerocolumna cellulosilytica]|uniref:L-serine deaminase n=1 Tax=Anaerocolumna cellulosilytica TaxID=433286 RepID=A0A6S6R6V8_9FIRM|nr:L-serine ammonia-lyase, iron-sulfur-dependent subunit beta [Anaerocolumna cellulosilytica]MBB5194048.1 L-serine dehydratase [Anaerocolumna cellulosilytica]BCJ94738.1 L-serine dehydratase, iron-sulfur-dependent subunit beta [Anaerocolumna cellulosilytica]